MITILSYRIDTPRGSIDLFSDNKEYCLDLWKRYYSHMEGAKFVEITTTREENILEEVKPKEHNPPGDEFLGNESGPNYD